MKYPYSIMFLCLLISINLFSQEKIEADFEQKDGKIFIYYSLEGSATTKYKVSVLLKREKFPSFEYGPEKLIGDVGEGFFATGKKTIIWELSDQEKKSFASGDDYWFEVSAEEAKGGIPWYYYVGGAVVAGAGAIVAILLGGKEGTEETKNETFPSPPVRP